MIVMIAVVGYDTDLVTAKTKCQKTAVIKFTTSQTE